MILDPGLVQWMIDTGSRPSVVDLLANIGNTSNLDSNHFGGHCTLYKEHFFVATLNQTPHLQTESKLKLISPSY